MNKWYSVQRQQFSCCLGFHRDHKRNVVTLAQSTTNTCRCILYINDVTTHTTCTCTSTLLSFILYFVGWALTRLDTQEIWLTSRKNFSSEMMRVVTSANLWRVHVLRREVQGSSECAQRLFYGFIKCVICKTVQHIFPPISALPTQDRRSLLHWSTNVREAHLSQL